MISVHESILNKCNGEEAALRVINRGLYNDSSILIH